MKKNLTRMAAILLASGFLQAGESASQLPPNARVAILGDSITEQKLYSKFIETYLFACAGRPDVKCFQFGKSGETAGSFLIREELALGVFHPTVATICYGMNDACNAPYSEKIGNEYATNMRAVLTEVRTLGVTNIIVGTPGAVDTYYFRRGQLTPAQFNDNLAHLGEIGRKLAAEFHLGFADVHAEMVQTMAKAKAALGPDFAVCGKMDGAHPDANGHLLMAAAFLKGLGVDGNIGEITVDMNGPSSATGEHQASGYNGVAEVESARYPFCFDRDALSSDGTRSIVPFCDFNEKLNRLTLRVKNLDAPKARVTWGSQSRVFTKAQLAVGINLAAEFTETPFDDAFFRVMAEVGAKQIYETCMMQDLLRRLGKSGVDSKINRESVATLEAATAKLFGEQVKLEAQARAKLVPVKHTIKVEAASALAQNLDLPLERQVFQRNEQEWAEVKVAGPVPDGATLVEAKAELSGSGLRGEPVNWTVVATGDKIKDGKFSGSLKLATGSWYKLTVRFRKSADEPTILGEATIGQVGVGDIFVTAGQSNSVNHGQPKQKSGEDLCVYFDGKKFTPAADPMPDASGEGGTPWPILGDMLSRSTHAPVCFRSATVNYTRVRLWVPGAPSGNIERLVERAKWFGPAGIRAVLWVQGEADADAPGTPSTTAAEYERDATAMIEYSRKQLGWNVDWFVAGNSYIPAKPGKDYRKSIADILGAQKTLWDKGVAFRGPDTVDLFGSQAYRHDGVHFGPRGLLIHAERWYAELSSHYQWANPVTSNNK